MTILIFVTIFHATTLVSVSIFSMIPSTHLPDFSVTLFATLPLLYLPSSPLSTTLNSQSSIRNHSLSTHFADIALLFPLTYPFPHFALLTLTAIVRTGELYLPFLTCILWVLSECAAVLLFFAHKTLSTSLGKPDSFTTALLSMRFPSQIKLIDWWKGWLWKTCFRDRFWEFLSPFNNFGRVRQLSSEFFSQGRRYSFTFI